MAEYYMYKGAFTPSASTTTSRSRRRYRQFSLLLSRPLGREAYPGDVFYLHSRSSSARHVGRRARRRVPFPALPVIETQEGEVSAYIPTNVITITDGQIYLEPELFFYAAPRDRRRHLGSVWGGNAQIQGGEEGRCLLRLDWLSSAPPSAFAQFVTELDKATQKQLPTGASAWWRS